MYVIGSFLFENLVEIYSMKKLCKNASFPNKEYTGKVCIEGGPDSVLTLTNDSGIIKSFSVSELKPMGFREFRCGTYTFSVNDFKTTDELIVYESLLITDKLQSNVFMGVNHGIKIDASNVSYVNLLLKISGKLIVTFISIFAVLSLLLYMIRKIRKE